MTDREAIEVLNTHLVHWKRLVAQDICDSKEGREMVWSMEKAIKALSAPIREWIPCKSEMPRCEHDEYFVTWEAKFGIHEKKFVGIEIIEFDGDDWIIKDIEKRGFFDVTVTAWMELPKPYEEDADEQGHT